MGIRLPLKVLLSTSDTATTGTVAYPFTVPQDSQSIVVKLSTGTTFTGTSPTLDVYVQTSEDGGTTWRDCANLGQLTAAVNNDSARFVVIPVAGAGGGRGLGAFIGSVQASTTAANVVTGLPILSTAANRIYLKYGGTQLSNNGVVVTVYSNSQDGAY